MDKILRRSQIPPKQPTTRSTNSTAISQSAGSKTPVVSTHKHPQLKDHPLDQLLIQEVNQNKPV